MFPYQESLSQEIFHNISLSNKDGYVKLFYLLSGKFGIGKSELINQIESEIIENKTADGILKINDLSDCRFLTDFACKLIDSFRLVKKPNSIATAETCFYKEKFDSILNECQEMDFEIFEKLYEKEYMLSYPDYINNNQDMNGDEINDELKLQIEQKFPKKSDKSILFDVKNIIAESIIVDLMNLFFPNATEKDYLDFISLGNPIKVLIIIDNYDTVAGTILNWLISTFFNYCYSKSFNDFNYYNITKIDSIIKINHFFDFRFIIASRDNIAEREFRKYDDELLKLCRPVKLEPYSSENISEFFRGNENSSILNFEFINKITNGIPYLLMLWEEYIKVATEISDYSIIYKLAFESILQYYTTEQQDWIIGAAFLDEFDAEALKCLPMIGIKSNEVFNFLKNSQELTITESNGNRVKFQADIGEYIQRGFTFESADTAKKLTEICTLYSTASEILNRFSGKEREIIRNLSYFKRFDLIRAFESAFKEDAEIARRTVEKYPDFFIKNQMTYSIIPDSASILIEYNKLYEPEKYEKKLFLVEETWENCRTELSNAITINKNELTILKGEFSIIEQEYETKRKKYLEQKHKTETIQKELVNLKERKSLYISRKSIYNGTRDLSIGVVLIIIGFLSHAFFSGIFSAEATFTIIKYIFLISGSIFSIIGLVKIIQKNILLSKKEELQGLLYKINNYEKLCAEANESFEKLKSDYGSINEKFLEFDKKINSLNENIKEYEMSLQEPFIE
jgi:hypothetical protein